MTSDKVKYVIRQFIDRPCRPRELVLPLDSGKVVVLAGVRRSGKAFPLFDTMRRLDASGVARPRLVYLNFEDDRLQPIREGANSTSF